MEQTKENIVFIIEDDPANALMIKQTLQSKVGNLLIHEFDSVEKAIDIGSLRPDIMILDHFLPLTNGITALPLLREEYPACSIAMLSSQTDIKLFTKAYERGVKQYITKNKEMFTNLVKFVTSEIIQINKTKPFWNGFFSSGFDDKSATKKQIAIVDDDEGLLSILKHKLSKNSQFKVDTFSTFDHFITDCDKQLDVIVLDYQIGHAILDVHIITKIIQQHPKAQLVCLSSNTNIEVAAELKFNGIHHYMQKSQSAAAKLKDLLISS
jgi:DNA-binding NarL/FixJ family response regulator